MRQPARDVGHVPGDFPVKVLKPKA